jgi:hypothetical protein
VGAVVQRADKLVAEGLWEQAIELLTESNRREENAEIETRLVSMRHRAFIEVVEPSPPKPWPVPVPDLFPDVSTIPEIPAAELCVELVASAIQHHGSLLVRGLIDPESAEGIRQAIDEAFAGAAAAANKPSFDPTPWYTHFRAIRKKGYRFGGRERSYASDGDGVHAVDSPRALFRHLDSLAAAGFNELLYKYFDERPAFSAKKTTLRRTPPNALAGWHQDGSFLGTQVRSLNIWTAFSPCGVDAPSLDIFPRPFDHLVEMGGADIFDWAVSNETAVRYNLETVVRPRFETGDALLFDQMTLHRTGVDSTMTKTRYAIEMWFFAASTYPHAQVPLFV